ncbi:MAG: hypothetical protein AAF590_11240 [Pseudomonadota bacterium]
MVLFKGRSSERDKSSDTARIASLIKQIDDVRAGIRRERRGLERRYSEVVYDAAHIMDTGYEGERGEAAEEALSKVENDALYARRRMSELDRHTQSLEALAERVKVMFDPVDEIAQLRKR